VVVGAAGGSRDLVQSFWADEALAPGHLHGMYEAFVDHPPFDEPPNYQRAQHRGHEMLFVIKGRIDVAFPTQAVKLDEGDSIVFSGQIPHRVLSLRPKRAEILVIVTNDQGRLDGN
jgi:mannose-6-phosphate isomerase-like protein (cupin superfamily)